MILYSIPQHGEATPLSWQCWLQRTITQQFYYLSVYFFQINSTSAFSRSRAALEQVHKYSQIRTNTLQYAQIRSKMAKYPISSALRCEENPIFSAVSRPRDITFQFLKRVISPPSLFSKYKCVDHEWPWDFTDIAHEIAHETGQTPDSSALPAARQSFSSPREHDPSRS